MHVLRRYPWPGNVRELENTMARACALASSQILLPADIPLASAPEKSSIFAQSLDHIINSAPSETPMLEWFSKQLVGRLLDRSGGDLKDAAAVLGLELSDIKRILSK
jgi:DNA-binding NtrC family response regulator